MARAAMATLISRTRSMIGDTAASPQFTDDQVEDALDEHRHEVRQMPLEGLPTLATGGVVTWLVWCAPFGWWETDEVLQTGAGTTLTPSASDEMAGRWTMSTTQTLGVLLTGVTYDLNAAAADLCDQWAAALAATQIEDITTAAGERFKRGDRAASKRAAGDVFRGKARPRSVLLTREDLA